jgi:hypothetical protein
LNRRGPFPLFGGAGPTTWDPTALRGHPESPMHALFEYMEAHYKTMERKWHKHVQNLLATYVKLGLVPHLRCSEKSRGSALKQIHGNHWQKCRGSQKVDNYVFAPLTNITESCLKVPSNINAIFSIKYVRIYLCTMNNLLLVHRLKTF